MKVLPVLLRLSGSGINTTGVESPRRCKANGTSYVDIDSLGRANAGCLIDVHVVQ